MQQHDHNTLKEWALELKTIDSALENAANQILENCEKLVNRAGTSSEIQESVGAIMENCSFHDLNSQRLRKIIKGLGLLIDQQKNAFSMGEDGSSIRESSMEDSAEVSLVSGPQRPEIALSQSEVEALLKN